MNTPVQKIKVDAMNREGEDNVWVSPHSGCQRFRIGSVTSPESSQYHQDANPSLLLETQKATKLAFRKRQSFKV